MSDLETKQAMTLTEKILARASGHTGPAPLTPGDEVWATADVMIMNDSSGPRRLGPLVEELGGLWDRDRVVVVSDHFTPAANLRHAEILKGTRAWAKDQKIGALYEYQGILHNLVLEGWHVRPGMLLVGADSHTVTAGAVGAVAVAVGSTELATVLATGQVWLRVPESVRIELTGTLGPCVDLRDVTMRLLGDLGIRYASYRALEFGGSFVSRLSVEDRLVLSNQGIEMGAKNAVVVPSAEVTLAMEKAGLPARELVLPDPDATYAATFAYDVSAIGPLVAAHPSPDHVAQAHEVTNVPIDMAWIGSCVGGRLSDLHAAARVLRGKKARVPLLVTPNTTAVYQAALLDGTIATLVGAGAVVNPPGCGACAGVHMGVLGPGDVAMATATRNFKGRMGSGDSKVFLGSAYSVAAAAIAGRVIDPRELGTSEEAS